MFRSVQMTLNGLTPFQAYEIHCYHAAHDVISYTDTSNNALAKTDLASLSGVAIAMSDEAGAWVTGTLTVTFTHEKTLLSTNKIYLALYDNFESVQTLTIGGSCAASVFVKSTCWGVAKVLGGLPPYTCCWTVQRYLPTHGLPKQKGNCMAYQTKRRGQLL